MGREISILWIGRHQRDEWDRLCDRYRERIERFVPLSDRPLKAGVGSDAERAAGEAAALRRALPDPAWTVALDRRGRQRSSTDLATWLTGLLDEWPHPVVFLIGSDVGLDRALVGDCRERLSLGAATLPHQLARLVLYEQLYRALSINAGIKYHRGPL